MGQRFMIETPTSKRGGSQAAEKIVPIISENWAPVGRKSQYSNLPALAGAVAGAAPGGTVPGLSQFAIGTDAGLGVHAPVQSVIGTLHVRVGLGLNELSLPA